MPPLKETGGARVPRVTGTATRAATADEARQIEAAMARLIAALVRRHRTPTETHAVADGGNHDGGRHGERTDTGGQGRLDH